jgi:hypothetical protein
MRVVIAMLSFLLGVGSAAAFGLARGPGWGPGRPAVAGEDGRTAAGRDEEGTRAPATAFHRPLYESVRSFDPEPPAAAAGDDPAPRASLADTPAPPPASGSPPARAGGEPGVAVEGLAPGAIPAPSPPPGDEAAAEAARARAQALDADIAAGHADTALVERADALVATARALLVPGRGELADPECGGHACRVRVPPAMAPSLRPWLAHARPDVFVRPPGDGHGDGSVLVYLVAAEEGGGP